jgi:quercetin dioxygenase-like cupin family protein
MAIRRVVTGHDSHGTAAVLFDGPAANVRVREAIGLKRTLVWTTAGGMPAPYARADRGALTAGAAPAPGGTQFHIVEIPPGGGDVEAQRAAFAAMGIPPAPGRRAPRHPLMHATESVDYAIVLAGEIDMLLDETEVHLRAGDVVVQQGTNHAWVNRGTEPCTIAFVMIDAAGSPLIPTE